MENGLENWREVSSAVRNCPCSHCQSSHSVREIWTKAHLGLGGVGSVQSTLVRSGFILSSLFLEVEEFVRPVEFLSSVCNLDVWMLTVVPSGNTKPDAVVSWVVSQVAMKWWLLPHYACSSWFRGFFGCFSSLIQRIHFVLLSLIIFSHFHLLELYSNLLVSSLRANPWHYAELVSWSVLIKNR